MNTNNIEKLSVELSREFSNNYLTISRMTEDKCQASIHTFGSVEDEKLAQEAIRALVALGKNLIEREKE